MIWKSWLEKINIKSGQKDHKTKGDNTTLERDGKSDGLFSSKSFVLMQNVPKF